MESVDDDAATPDCATQHPLKEHAIASFKTFDRDKVGAKAKHGNEHANETRGGGRHVDSQRGSITIIKKIKNTKKLY